ncbi:30S ribosomal protein S20 [Candidatus Hydrogenosomobacter endosymbioticus]|uniref:Small ribosomal subunit protein bS20 n=1 Tax=Candidatus Hydrogenosomobacter endosymbioticus TaxID=2558174 RepID=A0ABM7V9X9_9PROT|nr:30S ribosomal protein S20 [Candidatus Hydrogenosomobacter endosymbioticus]BDB96588.1 30S ribosomal protein S20 [Candidatus Hydrogenosomobacter endosymbioticus]
MPQNVSPKKRLRRDARRRMVNKSRMGRIRTSVKRCADLVSAGDSAFSLVRSAQSELAKGVSVGIMHKNTAARKIRKLMIRLNRASG